MSTTYIGALDQGTSGTRFVVFDERGDPTSEAFTSHRPTTREGDRVEYDPLKLWGCATDAIRRGLVQADVDSASALRALGVSSQRQTVLLWEAESGTPVTNAISWRDRRTTEQITELTDEERRLIRERTGLEPDPYFAAPNAKWLLDHGRGRCGDEGDHHEEGSSRLHRGSDDQSGLRERAEAGEVLLGTVDSWLLYNLTGTHATDVTNAAQTMLFDIHELQWDDDLLDLFDVPRAALPAVHASSDPSGFGTTDPNGILNAAVPVTGVMGDQQAALLGRVACGEGDAKVTYGTGNFFLQNTGSDPVAADGNLLTTVWFQRAGAEPRYGLEGPVFATGAVLEWLRTIGLLEDAGGLAELDSTESPGDLQLVPGFGGLGAPHWVPDLRAGVFGLRRETDPDDVLRAAVEAIAFGTRAVLEAAEAATGIEQRPLLVDGGAIQDDEFAQWQADLLDRRLVRSNVTQTTALGAGFAAGLATGVWDSLDDLAPCQPTGRAFTPSGDASAAETAYQNWGDVVDAVVRCHGTR
ncbi:FGGY family carbohydrate kinase [Halobellus inordinatus]|uniref:FGGY family carbohydrate kinase n=1 Tax=Halobellus inordinatus TaxID=1126236 RepID=UPI002113C1CA|nr:FGGY family carbohydrate kinase [Halobellus ramosii]